MENVFNFRNDLIREYSSFSRSFSKIAASDIKRLIEAECAQGRYIRQHGQIKRAEVMALCRLTEGQVKRLLQRMLAAKQIVMRGHGKKTAYVEPQ